MCHNTALNLGDAMQAAFREKCIVSLHHIIDNLLNVDISKTKLLGIIVAYPNTLQLYLRFSTVFFHLRSIGYVAKHFSSTRVLRLQMYFCTKTESQVFVHTNMLSCLHLVAMKVMVHNQIEQS